MHIVLVNIVAGICFKCINVLRFHKKNPEPLKIRDFVCI